MKSLRVAIPCEFTSGTDIETVLETMTPRERATQLLDTAESTKLAHEERLTKWYIAILSEAVKNATQSWNNARVRVLLGIESTEAKEVLENLEAMGNFGRYYEKSHLFYILKDARMNLHRLDWEAIDLSSLEYNKTYRLKRDG